MAITCDEGGSLIQTDIYVTLPLHSLLCHENRSLLTLKHINVICLNKISTDVYMQISTVVYERDKKMELPENADITQKSMLTLRLFCFYGYSSGYIVYPEHRIYVCSYFSLFHIQK